MRTTSKTRLLPAAAALVGALMLAACGGGGDSAPASTVGDGQTQAGSAQFGQLDFSLNWLKNSQYVGEYFADSKGYYTEAGFSAVNLIPGGPGGTSPMVMVASNQALLGTSNTLAVADSIANSDAPIKIIGTTLQSTPFTIISRADAPIRTPQDMIGKRIGNKTGANEAVWDAFLKVNNIAPDQVTTVTVQTDPQPLINGDIDGLVGFSSNEAVSLKLAGHDIVEMPMAEHGLNFATDTFIATTDSIEQDRDTLKAALYATVRGWQDAIADPEAGAKLTVEDYGSNLGLNLPQQTEQAKIYADLATAGETSTNGLFTLTDAQVEENMKAVEAMGYQVSKDELFDLSLIQELYQEHPDLKN